jgi:hypothetical protein
VHQIMLATRNIVFETSTSLNNKSRFAIFSIPSNRWTEKHAADIALLSPNDTLVLKEENLSFLSPTAENANSWTSWAIQTGAEVDGVKMYNAIAVLRLGRCGGGSKSAAVVLIPHKNGSSVFVKVVFLPMKQVDGYTTGNTRYKALKERVCDEHLGKDLFAECKLCFFRQGTVLRTPEAPSLQGKHRESAWQQAVVGKSLPGNKYLTSRPPAPQNVRMTVPAGQRLCSKIGEGQQLAVKVRYCGGKMHAPLASPLEPSTLKESLDAQYRVAPRPAADYAICVENQSSPNPVQYFGRALSVDQIVSAVRDVHEEAKAELSAEDVDELMGALAGCLYEDVGWKLADVRPLEDASISELLVDVDQVGQLVCGCSEPVLMI